MTRSELTHRLFRRFPHLTEEYVERIISLILEEITQTLSHKNRAEFRSFGSFSVRHRNGRVGRNPKTGEHVQVKEKDFPFFKCGRTLLSHLNHWDPNA